MAQLTAKIDPARQWPDEEQARVFLWLAEQQQDTAQAVRALLHRIRELEGELAKPRPVQVKLAKADVEEAAAALFATHTDDGPATYLIPVNERGIAKDPGRKDLSLAEVTVRLCESLGVR